MIDRDVVDFYQSVISFAFCPLCKSHPSCSPSLVSPTPAKVYLPVLKSGAAGVKYDKVIFVGDSRMVELSDLVANDNIQYIAKRGIGVNWLKGSGYPKLQKAVKKTKGRKAVVFFIENVQITNAFFQTTFHFCIKNPDALC